MVEPDECLGDDQPAVREPVAHVRELDRRLERRDVVVCEVADDRQADRLGLLERPEPPAGPIHELRPSRPRSTDSSRKLALPIPRRRRYAPSGVSRSVVMVAFGVIASSRRKRPPWEASGETDVVALLAHAPASPLAPRPDMRAGGSHLGSSLAPSPPLRNGRRSSPRTNQAPTGDGAATLTRAWRAQSSSPPLGRRSGGSAAGSRASRRPSSERSRSAPGSSARGSTRRKSATSSWARCCRPGRARPPARQAAIAAGSRRRCPRTRSTRCARRRSARSRSPS